MLWHPTVGAFDPHFSWKKNPPGLRTLVIGCRSIPADEASAWLTRFHEARLSLVEKFHHGRGR